MNDLNYIYLGRLKPEVVEQFKKMVSSKMTDELYHWVYLTRDDHEYYKSVFNHPVIEKCKAQKALVSTPDHGFRIHKDEPGTLCALNVIVNCNPTDWIRWYDEAYIDSIAKVENIELMKNGKPMRSRNIQITAYDYIPYVDEVINQQPGDVYIVNTDKYHSFKCEGPDTRIVIQTKFSHCPSIEDLAEDVKNNIFADYMI